MLFGGSQIGETVRELSVRKGIGGEVETAARRGAVVRQRSRGGKGEGK